jgi:hypothetical protein
MSTLQEIEQAIEHLSAAELSRVEEVLRRMQARHGAGDDLATMESANGFDVLPERAGGPVSAADVRRLCAEEGI